MPDFDKNDAPHWSDPDSVGPDGKRTVDLSAEERNAFNNGEGDPDTTVEGDAFVDHGTFAVRDLDDLDDDELDALLDAEEAAAEVVDVFSLVVTYAQERGNAWTPAFESYDEARDAGVELLRNHADAQAFSITKSTILR